MSAMPVASPAAPLASAPHDAVLSPPLKGWPHDAPALAASRVGAQGWSVAGDLPLPVAVLTASAGWRIDGLNDQHAYQRWGLGDAIHAAQSPVVGERSGLGISHPCTTFDKWHWMPMVDEAYHVCDAVTMQF